MADRSDDALDRVRKLMARLEAAQRASDLTNGELARARAVTNRVNNDVRLHDTSSARKRSARRRKASS